MAGRKPFEPTAEQRDNVGAMVGYGMPLAKICRLIRNPQTGKALSEPTLLKAFPTEIATGRATVEAMVGGFIVNTILGRKGGLKDERSRATLAIFFAKTQMDWKETVVAQHEGKNGGEIIFKISKDDSEL
jgi:hypothetical protein